MTVSTMVRAAAALGGLLFLTNCVSAPAPAPTPEPRPAPPVTPTPPAPVAKDWREWPVARGDWSYRAIEGGTLAAFGEAGRTAELAIRCELATRRLSFARVTAAQTRPGDQMTVHTSFGAFQWPVSDIPTISSREQGSTATFAVAVRASNDSSLDKIAFSRGRFAIEAPGAPPLSVPGWAEVSRVIEDCRG
ncbi:MAG: hypothetical protein AB7E05_03735 [Sphingobium sp.]